MARYLLDTHTFVWFATLDPKLSAEAYATILDAENTIFISVASIWEISIKRALGKLPPLPGEPEDLAAESSMLILDINASHATLAGRLPLLHRDPFDRMLIAQAQIEDLILITDDRRIERYDVSTLRP